jgi:TetR/AcrR family fatty acid metabolism transcriptional regulator
MLKARAGKVLYVGHADDLRTAVTALVTSREGRPPGLTPLLSRVEDVEALIMPSPAEAERLAQVLIQQLAPEGNDPEKRQRVTERREQILEAATEVFVRKGVHEASIRDIAREAGIADGTVYLYFKNKDDLLREVLIRLPMMLFTGALGTEIDLADEEEIDDHAILSSILRAGFALGEHYVDYLRFFFAALQTVSPELRRTVFRSLNEQVFPVFQVYVQQRIEQRAFRDVDPLVLSRVLLGMALIFIQGQEVFNMKEEIPFDYDELAPALADVFLHGVVR